jgi:hypothetical protein
VRLEVRVCVAVEINPDEFVISTPGSEFMRDAVYVGTAVLAVVKLTPVDDLSVHRDNAVPDAGGIPSA